MSGLLSEALDEARDVVLQELDAIIPGGTPDQRLLKELILDYPLRAAKGLAATQNAPA